MNMNDITGAFGLAQLQVIEPYLQKHTLMVDCTTYFWPKKMK